MAVDSRAVIDPGATTRSAARDSFATTPAGESPADRLLSFRCTGISTFTRLGAGWLTVIRWVGLDASS